MKTIYYRQDNGSMGLLAFFNESVISEKIAQLEKDGIPFGEVTDQVKIDHSFFDAYVVSQSGELSVNLEKAKEIHRNSWRAKRTPLLQQLDVDYMRAVERADAAAQQDIAAQKQRLRDVTLIELPDSLEGIKATIPEVFASYSTNYDENGVQL